MAGHAHQNCGNRESVSSALQPGLPRGTSQPESQQQSRKARTAASRDKGFEVVELAGGVTREEVQRRTEAAEHFSAALA
jgi:hypothetical protein